MCCKGSQQVKDSEGDSDTSWICVYVSFLSTWVYMNISMNDLTYKYVLNVQANTLWQETVRNSAELYNYEGISQFAVDKSVDWNTARNS